MTSYLLHQPPSSGFGVVCMACEQRNLFFSAPVGDVSDSDKSVQGQSRRPVWYTPWEGVCSWVQESPGPAGPASCSRKGYSCAPAAPAAWSGSTRRGKTSPIFLMVAFSSACRTTVLSPRNVYRWDDWHHSGASLKSSLLSTEDTTLWNKTH